jgi:hypothetical protein
MTTQTTCAHCGRTIVQDGDRWVDPEASGDDIVWRETCDQHDTFTAEHEPVSEFYVMGQEAGQARASWVEFDDEAAYRKVLQGIEDCDPEVMDGLSVSPLSGEWAGESMTELLGDDYTDEDADQYEQGFQDAYWSAIEETCRYHLS